MSRRAGLAALTRHAPEPRLITEGIIWRQLLAFAVPIMISNLLQQFYNTADLMIVGRYAGHEAMASIGATGSLTNLIIGLFLGFATGASVVLAQYYGAGDGERIQATVHSSMALSLLSGAILTALGIVLSPILLGMMNTPADAHDGAVLYLRVIFAGIIPSLIYNFGASLLRAVGDSRRPLYFLTVSVVANIGLDLLFVGPLGLGVLGAGLATIISQSIAATLTLLSLTRSLTIYRLYLRELRFDREVVSRVLRIGIPCGLQSMLLSFSNVVIQSQINSFGTAATAGAAAAGRIDGFLYMPKNAFGLAATTFTGQNIGAGRLERVRRGAFTALAMAMTASLLMSGVLALNMRFFIELFSDDPQMIDYGVTMLSYFVPLYWLFGIVEVLSGAVRGAGRAQVPMVGTLVCLTGFRLVWNLIVLPRYRSFDVLCMCYPLSWALLATVILIFFMRGRWVQRDGKWLSLRRALALRQAEAAKY